MPRISFVNRCLGCIEVGREGGPDARPAAGAGRTGRSGQSGRSGRATSTGPSAVTGGGLCPASSGGTALARDGASASSRHPATAHSTNAAQSSTLARTPATRRSAARTDRVRTAGVPARGVAEPEDTEAHQCDEERGSRRPHSAATVSLRSTGQTSHEVSIRAREARDQGSRPASEAPSWVTGAACPSAPESTIAGGSHSNRSIPRGSLPPPPARSAEVRFFGRCRVLEAARSGAVTHVARVLQQTIDKAP